MAVRGGCSVVPSGLDLFMWVLSQHFVLGYVRSSLRDSGLDSRWRCVVGVQSSLRDLICLCGFCPSTSCWAMFGRPFGTLVLIPDGGAWGVFSRPFGTWLVYGVF